MSAFSTRRGSKGSILDFRASVMDFADAVEATVSDATSMIALAIYNGVVARTPVDTGFARSQWQVLFNGDTYMVREVGDHTGSDAAKLAGYDVVAHGAIEVANGAAYIKKLEYEGHSLQAPEGMVRVTLVDVQARLDEIMRAAARENGLGTR